MLILGEGWSRDVLKLALKALHDAGDLDYRFHRAYRQGGSPLLIRLTGGRRELRTFDMPRSVTL